MLFGLLIFGCTSQKSNEELTNPVVSDELAEDTAKEPEEYISSRSGSQSFEFTYDRATTAGNPLKGLLSSYLWSEPHNDLPHSLEFIYIPLNALVADLDTYTFEAGLEPHLQAASDRGNHVVMRVFIDYPTREYGLPNYLEELVSCSPYLDYGGGCSPDYSNPHLQSAILNFISEFGNRYDGDNRIGFIQMGLLGYWGEWHTFPNTENFANGLFQQEVIDMFDTSFHTTPIQIRYPIQDSVSRSIGFHDDSFAYATVGDVDWYFWSKMEAASAENRWMEVPTGGEVYPPIQSILFTDSFVVDEDGQDFDLVVSITHATYMLMYSAFSMSGTGYVGDQLERAKQSSLAMGYEFSIEDINVEASNLHGGFVDLSLEIAIQNTGVAPFYYPLNLSVIGSGIENRIEHIEDIQPSEQTILLPLEVIGVPTSSINKPWTVQLTSDVLLENQVIYFANVEDSAGVLTVTPKFVCQYDSQEISLGQSIADCFCDVDGIMYTVDGDSCH